MRNATCWDQEGGREGASRPRKRRGRASTLDSSRQNPARKAPNTVNQQGDDARKASLHHRPDGQAQIALT